MKIRTRLTLLTFALIFMTSLLTLGVTVVTVRHEQKETQEIISQNIRRGVREQLKSRVDAVISLLKSIHGNTPRQSPEVMARKQQWLFDRLGDLRFDRGHGYYWVQDTSSPCPRVLMHPVFEEYENGSLCDHPELDPKDSPFMKAYNAVLEQGSGFIEYEFQHPSQSTGNDPKISYVKLFEPWGIVIGSGAYLDDVEKAVVISQERTNATIREIVLAILLSLVLILVLAALAAFYFSNALSRPVSSLQRFTESFSAQPDQPLTCPLPRRRDEIGKLHESFIDMACVIQKSMRALKVTNRRLRGKNEELHVLNRQLTEKESEVRLSNLRLKLVAENIQEVLFLLDSSDDSVLYVSPVVERLFGYTPEQIKAAWPRMEGIISEENRASLSFFDPGRRYRTIVDEEFRAVRPDGEVRWLRLRSFPVYDDSGNAIGAAGIFADVTMFKVMGEQQRLHREQLMHADKMASLGVLVSSIAHEINNPNNFLLLNAKIIERTWLEIRPVLDRHAGEVEGFSIANLPYADARERLPKLLEGICEGGERIRRIIETLRMYARKEGENGHGSVCLNEVVNSALTICGHFINKATHELIVEQTPDLPPVQGNFQQLEQVMINLLTNAGQALPSPEKSICVRTYAHTDENRVVMEVQDEGCGIPEEGLEQLTSPFFTTKGASGGTGLGLSISNDIVKRHGGKLVFESKPGRGTTASVVLPCH